MQDFNQEIYDALSEMMTARMEEGVHTSAPATVGKVENNNTAELTPELEDAGLILRVRRGVGEPNRIYTLLPQKEGYRDE